MKVPLIGGGAGAGGEVMERDLYSETNYAEQFDLDVFFRRLYRDQLDFSDDLRELLMPAFEKLSEDINNQIYGHMAMGL